MEGNSGTSKPIGLQRATPRRSHRWSSNYLSSSERGFTLIEVMVALTLLALVAGLLASGTRLSLDVSERGNARAETRRTEKVELDVFRAQLAGTLPYHHWTRLDGRRTEFVAFEG